MIRLFITDIDGCLLEPMKTPDWETLSSIRSLNRKSGDEHHIPPLTICTGRPMPYAEAVAQMMGIDRPVIFENAGVFDPDGYQIHLNNSFTDNVKGKINELKSWLQRNVVERFEGATPEFSKIMDAGIIHPEKSVIQKVLPNVREYVSENYQNFEVNWTDISINVILKENDKRTGIKTLSKLAHLDPSEVAYIGDSGGDITGLKLAGRSFAPQNATEEVKQVSEVLDEENTKAVLAAYHRIIEANSN